MTKSLIPAVTALLCFALSAPAFSAPASAGKGTPGVARIDTVTLKESILFALDRDPSVGQQAAQLGIGQAQIDEARSGWFPQISLNGSTGHSQTTDSSGSLKNSTTWALTVTQLVYDFGKTQSSINQQKSQEENYRYQLMATFTDVAEKTALAYVEVKRYDALNIAAQEHITALEGVQRMVSLRADAGLNSRSDVLLAQTRITGMKATLEQYRASLQSARARLGVLTGVQATKYAEPPQTLVNDPVPLDQIDYTWIPAVLAARAQESASGYAVDRAKSQHWPTLSLQGGRTRYESDNRSYWDDQVQLKVDAPLYQGGAVSARVRQAEGARQMASTQVDQARFDILQKAAVAQADWQGANGREQAGQQQLDNARRTRDVYKNEYTLSKRSLSDLLSVEQDIWQAALSRITAEYDSWVAAVNYAAALDTLLPLTGIEKNTANTLPDLN